MSWLVVLEALNLRLYLTYLASEFKVELDQIFVSEYRELVDSYFKQELSACDGVEKTLAQINLPMCVATNGPLAKMQRALEVTNLSHYFGSNLFSAYDIESWKPDPGLFLYAAKTMGFEPQECLVIEDSRVGIQAAEAAGIKALLYDPNHVHQSLVGDKTIHHFEDVLTKIS